MVIKVEGGKVYTIEGNTSSAAGVVANGGCVRNKSYALTYAKIAGYGRPDYSMVPVEEPEKEETPMEPKAVADWAASAWEKAHAKIGRDGKPIMDGTRPTDNITRQEVAVILDRLGLLEP